jgi:ferredoxin-NADP reductase
VPGSDPGAGFTAPGGMGAPGPPVPRPGPWQSATVVDVRRETPSATTYRLALPEPMAWRAGQHVVLRLTAPDGYRATRSYSIASAPDPSGAPAPELELTVERLEGGEVSAFLHDVVAPGDGIELRGPIGGWFVWPGDTPAVLVGGGSGVVPLASMLRLARATGRTGLVRLAVSARGPEDLYYAAELPGPGVTIAYTRTPPAGWPRPAGRLGPDDLAPALADLPGATAYVCGSPAFADAATDLLTGLGHPVDRIRVERFGPTG